METGSSMLFTMWSMPMVRIVAIQNHTAAYSPFSRRRARVPNTLTA